SLKQHQRNLLNNSCVVSPDPESLNTWRLDYSYILAIYPYQFQNVSHLSLFKKINLLHNLVSSSECFSALYWGSGGLVVRTRGLRSGGDTRGRIRIPQTATLGP
ncbi:hypothetical protein ATANTOWER_030832, partial [Ataeniobius toweri]|nr:hypothetical protein [Ataeniobius toweri]